MMDTLSNPSPVGSEIFALIALLVVSLVVLLILRYFLPLRTTPAYLLVPVFFALWLPAGTILLVPVDLASSARTDDVATRGIWLPQRMLLVSWRITYWLTFALTWFILPILAEYSDAGYREPQDRLLYSLRENAQYQAILFGSGVLGLVYVFVTYGVSLVSLKGLVMALAYCWGLVLAIYLMGHGLVAIPRTLFRNASISGRLRRLQARAPGLYERMEDAMASLDDLEVQVSELSRRKTGSARDFQDWIEELVDMCSLPESRPRAGPLRGDVDSRILPTVITEKYLADLTRRLVRARQARSRYVDEWTRLLHDASTTQAVLDSAGSGRLDFGAASPSSGIWDRLTILTPRTRHLFHFRFLPSLRLLLGGFFALASACIVWSEMIKAAFPTASIIRLTVIHHWTGDTGQVGFAGQIIAALWILYMCAAALTSLAEVKAWRGRALVRRHTGHEAAFWYAGFVARLTVPLSYNFLTFLSRTVYEKTVFYDFLGELINLTPLGTWFDYLFPIFILVPVCATLFGLYGKVKRFFGYEMDLVDDDDNNPAGYGTGSWREGRDLIERELNGTSLSSRRDEAASSTAGLNTPGGARAGPILSVPSAGGQGRRTPFATSPTNRDVHNRKGQSASRSVRADEEPADDNFFANLGHRIQNTIDTLDKPRWLEEIGEGFKKPKWMGNDGTSGSNDRPPDAGRSSFGVRRWFGGDGGVRL